MCITTNELAARGGHHGVGRSRRSRGLLDGNGGDQDRRRAGVRRKKTGSVFVIGDFIDGDSNELGGDGGRGQADAGGDGAEEHHGHGQVLLRHKCEEVVVLSLYVATTHQYHDTFCS